MTNIKKCKSCKSKSVEIFFDFGKMPIVNNLIKKKKEKNKLTSGELETFKKLEQYLGKK